MFHFLDTVAETGSGSSGSQGSIWPTILMLVGMVAIFYFLIIRPQKKQEKQVAEMRNSIGVGDEIITIGGIVGTVLIIKDDKMMIETGSGSKITVLRSSVKTVLHDDDEEPAPVSDETAK